MSTRRWMALMVILGWLGAACGRPDLLTPNTIPGTHRGATPTSAPRGTSTPGTPPSITLSSRAGRQDGGMGSYCWPFPPSRYACADMVGVAVPAPPLTVQSGEPLSLDFSKLGASATADYRLYRYAQVVKPIGPHGQLLIEPDPRLAVVQGTLPNTGVATLRLAVPPGHYTLDVSASVETDAQHHEKGDTDQGFNLEVVAP